MAADNPWTGASQASQQPADPFAAAAAPAPMTPPQPQYVYIVWAHNSVQVALTPAPSCNQLVLEQPMHHAADIA